MIRANTKYVYITGGYNMNINLELFKVFYIVASQNSITKASKILYISQPAVSKLIGNLEKAIGITLFYRTSKGVALTPNGHALYNYLELTFPDCYESFFIVSSGDRQRTDRWSASAIL